MMNLIQTPVLRIRSYTVLVLAGWTLLILALLSLNIYWLNHETLDVIRAEARTNIAKDLTYRRWNAGHGGVYVPVTEDTQPNPYLDQPDRDVTTTDGLKLTLINPAYMVRQVHDQAEATGVYAHLTSLNPIRPGNAADEWEIKALRAFEEGQSEVSSIEKINGEDYLRLMKPMITEKACLTCHAKQGYKEGDIRGGLSVMIPMSNYQPLLRSSSLSIAGGYGVLWLLGAGGMIGVARDLRRRIFERERSLSMIHERDQQLRSVFTEMISGFSLNEIICDENGVPCNYRFLAVNPAFEAMTGLKAQDLVGKTVLEVWPQTEAYWIERCGRVALTGIPDHFENYSSAFDQYFEVRVYSPEHGKFAAMSYNVTDRRCAEEALKKSEQRFQKAFQFAPMLMTLSEIDTGRYIEVNDTFCSISGFSREEAIGKTSIELGWETHKDRQRLVCALKEAGFVRSWMLSLRAKDGREVLCEFFGDILQIGDQSALLSIAADITERSRAERSMHESEELFKAVVHNSSDLNILTDMRGVVTYVSPQCESVIGYSADNFIGKQFPDIIHPEDVERCHEAWVQFHQYGRELHEFEYRIVDKADQIRWVSHSARSVCVNNVVIGTQSTIRDATERKHADAALRQSEEKYRQLVEMTPDGLLIHADGEIVFANRAAADILGSETPATLIGKKLISFVHPDYRSVVADRVRNIAQNGHDAPLIEEKLIRLDGGIIDVEVIAIPFRIEDQNAVQVVFRDISERKKAEQALLENESALRRSQEIAHIGNWVWDIASNSLIWSDEMYRIFGIDKNEFTGNLADVIERSIHPEDKPRVMESNRRAALENRPAAMDYRVVHPDGKVLHVWARPDNISFDSEGKPVRLTGIVQDITERKKTEELLKITLAEKETLLRELYHRAKNNMQVINSMLDLQSSIVSSEEVKTAFKDMQNRIQSMALVHQKLYQSQSLTWINLGEYARSLVSLLISSYAADPNQIDVTIEAEDVQLTIDSAIPCGLIINELISNALKYAFPNGRHGHIRLGITTVAKNEFLLMVSDDGVGAPAGFDFEKSDTMGMVTLFTLGRQLGGSVEFENDRGVTCRVRFKNNLYNNRLP